MFAGITVVDLQRFILGCLTDQLATVRDRDSTSALGIRTLSHQVVSLSQGRTSVWSKLLAIMSNPWDDWDVRGVFRIFLLNRELVNVFYEFVLINCANFSEQTLLSRHCQVTNLTL